MKKIVSNLSAALLVGALMFTTSCKKTDPANITASSTSVAIGEDVKFTSSEVEKLKNTQVTYDFGDGGRMTGSAYTASHKFYAPGVYTTTVEFLHTKNAEKAKGKANIASIDITVNTVTPTITAKDANGADVTAVMVGQVVSLAATTDETASAQYPVSYEYWVNGVLQAYGKTANWTASTAGKYAIKCKATQYQTVTWSNELTVTVGGQSLTTNEMQAMIGGKWNVSSSVSYSGAGYTAGTPCFGAAPTYNNQNSAFYLNSNGNSTWSIVAFPTTEAGNLVSGGPSISVVNPTTVSVSGGGFPSGLYTTTVSGTSMVLTMTEKGGSATCGTTDVATITLTR